MPARYNKKDVRNAFESAFNTYADENQPYRLDITGTEDEYKYKYQIPNDMKGVMNVVAANQKGIKRIRNAETLEGARAYAAKHKNWAAVQADITGPNGEPDGVPEIFITDSTGKIRVVNGYTTYTPNHVEERAYEYIPREIYVNKKGNEAFRNAIDKEDWKRYLYNFEWNPDTQKPIWKNPVDDAHFQYLKDNKQLMKVLKNKQDNTKISPKRLWDHYVLGTWVKNVYDVSRYVKDLVPKLDSFVKARILGQAYNLTRAALIKYPIYMTKGYDWSLIGPARKKLENDANFKSEVNNRTVEYANAVARKGKTDAERNAMKEDLVRCVQCAIAFAARVILSGKSFGDDSTIYFGAVYNDRNNLGNQMDKGIFSVAAPITAYEYKEGEIKWGDDYRNKQKALKDGSIKPAVNTWEYNKYMEELYKKNKALTDEEYKRNALYKRDAYNNVKYNMDLTGYGATIPTAVEWNTESAKRKVEDWNKAPPGPVYAYSPYLTNGLERTILKDATRKGQASNANNPFGAVPPQGGDKPQPPPMGGAAAAVGGNKPSGTINPQNGGFGSPPISQFGSQFASQFGSTDSSTNHSPATHSPASTQSTSPVLSTFISQKSSAPNGFNDFTQAGRKQIANEMALNVRKGVEAGLERDEFVQEFGGQALDAEAIGKANQKFVQKQYYNDGLGLHLGMDNVLYDDYNNVKINMLTRQASKIDESKPMKNISLANPVQGPMPNPLDLNSLMN